MHQLTLAEIARGLADKQFSAEELSRNLLARIAQLDPQLNSFITVTADLAIEQAKAADARRAAGENSPLLGAPIAHIDSRVLATVAAVRRGRPAAGITAVSDVGCAGPPSLLDRREPEGGGPFGGRADNADSSASAAWSDVRYRPSGSFAAIFRYTASSDAGTSARAARSDGAGSSR